MFGKIIGTGSCIPKKTYDNNDLAKVVDTNDEWIVERTGIARRHVMEDETTSQLATVAATRALESAMINADEIDLVIVSTVSSDLILPNTACFVQEQIGAVNAMCFDINVACTGFMVAYNTAQSYINSGLIDTALIIGAEGLSNLVDWKDRETCILFGDGAGAAVIRKDAGAVFETVMHADGKKKDALTCKAQFADKQKSFIEMNGRDVFRFAVKQVPDCINELLDKTNLKEEDIDLFLLHQANSRIIQSIAKRIGTSSTKVPINLMEYGNTSSASIPILLDELSKSGEIKRGQKIIMAGFGAGLTWSATYLEY